MRRKFPDLAICVLFMYATQGGCSSSCCPDDSIKVTTPYYCISSDNSYVPVRMSDGNVQCGSLGGSCEWGFCSSNGELVSNGAALVPDLVNTCTNQYGGGWCGYGCSLLRSIGCISCSPGQYLLNGTSQCANCSAGHFSTSSAQSSCTACAAGTYQTARGAAAPCTQCPPDRMYSAPGATACTACAQNMSVRQVIRGRGDYLTGGLGSLITAEYDTWWCFRQSCVAANDYACYKLHASGEFHYWGLASELRLA